MIRPAAALVWVSAVGLAPLGLAAAVWPDAQPLVWLALFLMAVVCSVDAWFGRARLAGLEASPEDDGQMAQARESVLPVRLRKPAALEARGVAGLALPPSLECAQEEIGLALRAGFTEYALQWRITPKERGRYPLEHLHVMLRSPLGLWECGCALALGLELQVFPDAGKYGSLLARIRGQMGARLIRQVGKGREFEKLREYAPGDGFDEIHWKATARRGAPVTKVFQTERMQEIYAVVDVSRLMGRRFGESSALDEYLRVALLLGTAAEQRGDRFGVVLFHREVVRFLRARNGKAHYAACRKAMFDAQPEPVPADFFELTAFLRARVPKRSLLFLLTALDEPSAAESLQRAAAMLGRRHLPYVVMLQPGGVAPVLTGDSRDLYAGLAGHLQWRALRELELSLRTHGVRFHMVEPGELAIKILSLYDEVKQRQLL
ncbi:MAG TPA: DUF58 domain-containing protein [Bryobacteraceae bacterium]|nr:DUF58 domain-containing protein [Bryobacteraceae bacterium]